jgi:serine/threonine-protein kinase
MVNANQSSAPRRAAPAMIYGLMGLAVLTAGLAVFQWVELLAVMRGEASVCAIGGSLNCETVWGLPFAKTLHRTFGVPVAGLGLVWALVAGTLSLAARQRPDLYTALRLTGGVGVGACLVFFGVSLQAGAWCITCLTTYALVLAFAGLAMGLPRPRGWWSDLRASAIWTGSVAAAAYGLVLVPGLRTPVERTKVVLPQAEEAPPSPAPTPTRPRPSPRRLPTLQAFLQDLPPAAKRSVAQAIQRWRDAPRPEGIDAFAARHLEGDAGAPVRIVDFVDVGCVHCKHLDQTLTEIRTRFPSSVVSIQTRMFPLDRACNPKLGGSADGMTPRCLGAKALICAEPRPGYAAFKRALFDQQRQLSVARIEALAEQHAELSPDELRACASSADTRAKLSEDVAFAEAYDIRGTPLVLVNEKEGTPSAPFLYAMILAGAKLDAEGLDQLGL